MNRFSAALAGAMVLVLANDIQSQVPAYYYQGRHKVQVEVLTDALAIKEPKRGNGVGLRVAAALPFAKEKTAPGLSDRSVLVTTAQTMAELNQQAAKLRSASPAARVQAVLRKQEADPGDPVAALTDRISFSVKKATNLDPVVARYNLQDVSPVSYAKNTYTAQVVGVDLLAALHVANAMQESGDVEWAAPLVEEEKAKRAVPNDPLFPSQWHLRNLGSNTVIGSLGNDMNVVPAWETVTGDGVNIAIADDGVQTTHPDLLANVKPALGYDFNDKDIDPTPLPTHSHGTGCAGVAAGKGNNGIGITGAAPDAGIIGLRILAAAITDAEQALAMEWLRAEPDPSTQVAVHSNSWGPWDDGRTLEGPGPLTEAAVAAAATAGRNGKGTVFVWAAGNGRASHDNMNKDGYATNPHVIAVGATNSQGKVSYYSEPGSAMLVNAPSSDQSGGDAIYTTDLVGPAGAHAGDFRSNFGGTSSAAPAVAGVAALMLQANPDLTYRDVMHILVDTAVKNDPTAADWQTNGAGRQFNHNYGFGRVDAAAAVYAATTWQNVPPLAPTIAAAATIAAPVAIPDYSITGVEFSIPVTAPAGFVVEHVELETQITHTWRGDLAILLQSPSGMLSYLMLTGESRDSGDNYDNWRFRSVAHWGENATGNWRVVVADLYAADTGVVQGLTLRLRGYEEVQTAVDLWTLY